MCHNGLIANLFIIFFPLALVQVSSFQSAVSNHKAQHKCVQAHCAH